MLNMMRVALAALFLLGAVMVIIDTRPARGEGPGAILAPEDVICDDDERSLASFMSVMRANHPVAAGISLTPHQIDLYYSQSGMTADPEGVQVIWFSQGGIPSILVVAVRDGCLTSFREFLIGDFLTMIGMPELRKE